MKKRIQKSNVKPEKRIRKDLGSGSRSASGRGYRLIARCKSFLKTLRGTVDGIGETALCFMKHSLALVAASAALALIAYGVRRTGGEPLRALRELRAGLEYLAVSGALCPVLGLVLDLAARHRP